MRKASRRNAWPGQSRRHRTAAYLGWAHDKRRRAGPKSPGRYLAQAGVTPSSLRRFVSGRKTSAKRLRSKRRGGRRAMGVAYNPRSYRAFVGQYIRKHYRPGRKVTSVMKEAARAWRGGARDNQVAPGEVYFNRGRKRKRGRSRGRSRRNPVYRTRKGRFTGRKTSRRVSHNRRRGRSRRNPVLPYFAYENPVLPYAAFDNPIEAVVGAAETAFSPGIWTQKVLPFGGGLVGAAFGGGLLYGLTSKLVGAQTGFLGSVQRIGSSLGAAAVLSGATVWATKRRDIATNVLAGGLVWVAGQILLEVLGFDLWGEIMGKARAMEGMAADLTNELKRRIAASVREGVQSAGAATPGTAAFVSTQALTAAPHLGPGPRVGGFGDFVSTQGLRTAPVYGQPVAPQISDLDAFSNAHADMLLI